MPGASAALWQHYGGDRASSNDWTGLGWQGAELGVHFVAGVIGTVTKDAAL